MRWVRLLALQGGSARLRTSSCRWCSVYNTAVRLLTVVSVKVQLFRAMLRLADVGASLANEMNAAGDIAPKLEAGLEGSRDHSSIDRM